MNPKPREFCIICENRINRTGRSRNKPKRAKHAVTCSKKCARVYRRVHDYLIYKVKSNMEKNAKLLSKSYSSV